MGRSCEGSVETQKPWMSSASSLHMSLGLDFGNNKLVQFQNFINILFLGTGINIS
jgi:hypothetical protein